MSQPGPHISIHEQAADWLLRLRDASDAGARAEFEAWLEADPAHAAAFESVQSSWRALGEQAAAPELLAMRRDALARAHGRGSRRWAPGGIDRRRTAAGIAALVAVPAGAVWWLSARTSEAHTFRTGIGEQRVATLSDGSRVSLDANTLLRVAYSRELRLIELDEGRAHFEVARDPSRPMKVRAGAKTVTALEAAFVVEREPDQRVVVTLVEGKAAVLGGPGASIEMAPQQQLVADAGARPQLRRDVDVERALAWREGKLVFDDESLSEAALRMNNYSTRKIVVEGHAAESLRVSGVFHAGDTQAFVDAVKSYFPVTATTTGDTVIIRPKA